MKNKTKSTLKGQLFFNEPLDGYTTWRVGGKASCFYKPAGVADLAAFLKHRTTPEPLFWLGLGSNSLIRDAGFNGTVILTQGCLNEISIIGDTLIRVEAGVSCAKVARFSARNHLAGGEFLAGIPGTMGGALRMNAGCFDGETWQLVESVETMTQQGEIRRRTPQEFDVAYRHVSGLQNEWFTSATLRFVPGDKDRSMQRIKSLLAARAATQPSNEHTCGSVFRNPEGLYAARLIEECGLKGMRIGGAVISEKHANFIVNDTSGTKASDIEALILHIQTTVRDKKAITLLPEVHIWGDKA